MSDKTSYRHFTLPGGEHKRFEKTRSRRIYPAIWGLGVLPNKRPMAFIGHRDIACPLA